MDEDKDLFGEKPDMTEITEKEEIKASHSETKRVVNYNTNYNTNYNNNNPGNNNRQSSAENQNAKKEKKRFGCLFWGLVVLGIVIVVIVGIMSIATVIISRSFSAVVSDGEYSIGLDAPYVETLKIEGSIMEDASTNSYGMTTGYNHKWTLDEIKRLAGDENNKGIVLYINSPGGGTYESDELYLALKKYKTETGRPIYAYLAQQAASGALYASMASDMIYANRMTMTGSIGIIMRSYDASGFMEKLGVKEKNIKSGPNKDMFGYSGYTQDQEEILQAMVDESYDIFVGIVSEERGIELEKAYEIADGRVYSAYQAKELGLIDEVMSYDDFTSMLKEKQEFSGCEFIANETAAPSILSLFFSKLDLPELPKSDTSRILDMLEESRRTPFKYIAE